MIVITQYPTECGLSELDGLSIVDVLVAINQGVYRATDFEHLCHTCENKNCSTRLVDYGDPYHKYLFGPENQPIGWI